MLGRLALKSGLEASASAASFHLLFQAWIIGSCLIKTACFCSQQVQHERFSKLILKSALLSARWLWELDGFGGRSGNAMGQAAPCISCTGISPASADLHLFYAVQERNKSWSRSRNPTCLPSFGEPFGSFFFCLVTQGRIWLWVCSLWVYRISCCIHSSGLLKFYVSIYVCVYI